MILWTSKGEIGRWKAGVEKRIFGGDFRGGCMNKYGCENEEAPTIL